MNCKHCGMLLPNNAKYCPNCAEPVTNTSTFNSNKLKSDDLTNALTIRFLKGLAILILPSLLIALLISLVLDGSFSGLLGYLFSVFTFGLIFVVIDLMIVKNSKRKSSIAKQFYNDKTSICPMCGSHSINIYRKGYNYNEAFWGTMFKVKGSRYTAGMNANDTMCHCNNCGYKWNSGYDYRIIKK